MALSSVVFPAPRRPHDHADLAGPDLERAVVDGQDVDAFRVVDLRHVADADRTGARVGGHQRPSSASARVRHCIIRLPARRTRADVPPADEPERDHADHHRHRHVVHVGVDDEVAETPVSRHHLRRDEGEPRHPDADLQAGEDERERPRHHDVAEDLPPARAETAGGAEVRFVDGLDAEHRVQRGHEQRCEGGEEDDRRLETRKHQDGQRHPGQDRDRAQRLQNGEGCSAETSQTTP